MDEMISGALCGTLGACLMCWLVLGFCFSIHPDYGTINWRVWVFFPLLVLSAVIGSEKMRDFLMGDK